MVEVINPRTGEIENISRADPTFYSGGASKPENMGNSSKPKEIPPFVWQSMSVKARREASRKEQVKIVAKEAEKRLKARIRGRIEKT